MIVGRDLTGLRMCSRCIYDEKTPGIQFDEKGVCNYCALSDSLEAEYKTGTPEGERNLATMIEDIKRAGKGKKYDCVVGVSGGTDSSFMVYKAVNWGLRPLAVHYDNTWNSAIATENIRKVLGKLKVDLFTYVVDNKEMDDIFRSFLLAGVPELDGPTDIALAEVLYRASAKHGIKYILEGHSFKTEGVSPLATAYVDGKYISDVHRRYGRTKMKTFPNMDFMSFMKWILVKRIKKIRPFWYINYTKEDARAILEKEFGWQYYGGHHLENRMTAFHHSYYIPRRFNEDYRNNSLAASVRNGRLSREAALAEYGTPPHLEDELLEYFLKRMGMTKAEFEAAMNGPRLTYRDFNTYKQLFEKLRPFFYVMYRMHLVPKSFYIKYTSKSEI